MASRPEPGSLHDALRAAAASVQTRADEVVRLTPPSSLMMNADAIAASVYEAKESERQAQADLIVEPLHAAMERQHATLTEQHRALEQLTGVMQQMATVVKEQADELVTERSKREAAEGREGRKSAWLVGLTIALLVLTVALVVLGVLALSN